MHSRNPCIWGTQGRRHAASAQDSGPDKSQGAYIHRAEGACSGSCADRCADSCTHCSSPWQASMRTASRACGTATQTTCYGSLAGLAEYTTAGGEQAEERGLQLARDIAKVCPPAWPSLSNHFLFPSKAPPRSARHVQVHSGSCTTPPAATSAAVRCACSVGCCEVPTVLAHPGWADSAAHGQGGHQPGLGRGLADRTGARAVLLFAGACMCTLLACPRGTAAMMRRKRACLHARACCKPVAPGPKGCIRSDGFPRTPGEGWHPPCSAATAVALSAGAPGMTWIAFAWIAHACRQRRACMHARTHACRHAQGAERTRMLCVGHTDAGQAGGPPSICGQAAACVHWDMTRWPCLPCFFLNAARYLRMQLRSAKHVPIGCDV